MRIVTRAGPPHRPQERGNDHRDDTISDIGSSSSSHHNYPPRSSRVNPNSAHDNDSRHNNNKYDYGHNDKNDNDNDKNKNDNDNDKDKQGQNINPKYNPRGNNDEDPFYCAVSVALKQKQKLRSSSSSNSNVVNQLAVAATKTTTAATTATATKTKASAAAAAAVGANNNNNGIPFQTAGQTTAQRKQQHQHQQKKQHQHEPSALILQRQQQQQQQRHVATHENTTTRQDNTIINSRIMMRTTAIPSPTPNTASTFATTATAAPTTTTTATATTSRSSPNRNNNNITTVTTVTTLTFPAPLLFTSLYGTISPPVTPHPLMVQYASKGRLIKLQQLYNDRHNCNNSNNNNNNNSNNNNNTNNNNSSNNNNNNKNVLNVRQQSKLFNECAIRAYKPSWEEVVEKRFSYVDLDADFDQVLDGGYNGGGKTSNNNKNNNNNNNNNNYHNNNSNNEQKKIIMEKEEEIITKPTRLFYTDTPLIAASRNGHVHIVQWLLSSQVVDPTLESCPVGGDGGGSDDCGGGDYYYGGVTTTTTTTTGDGGKDKKELKVHNAVNVANRMLDILTNSILDLMEAFIITAPLNAVDLERNRRWRKKKKSWPIFFQFVPPIGVNESSSSNDNDDNKNNKSNNKKKKNQNKNVSITNQLLQQFSTQRSSQLLRALSSYHDILTMLSVALRAWSPARYSSHVADGRYSGSRNIFSNVIQLERLKYLHHGEEDEIDDDDNGSNESDVNDEDDTQYVTFANTELGKAIREELKNAAPLEILDSISEKNLARAIYRYNKLMFPVVDDDRNCDDHDGGSSGRVDSKDEIQTNAILDNDFVPTAASCPDKPVPTAIPKSMLIPELGLKYKPIRNSQRSLCAGLPPNLNERHSERRESLHHSAPPNSAECQLDEVMPVSLNVSHGAHSAEPSSKRRDSLHSSAPPNSTDSQRWGASMTNAGTHHNISRLPQLPQSIPPPKNRFGIFSPSKSKGKGNGSHCDSKLASSIHTVYSSTNAPSVLSSISKREPNQNKFNKTLQKVANNDSSLTRLKLDGVSNLDESQWQRLYGALGKNTCIEKVTLRRCQITDDIAFSFAVCLMENATIKSVDLRDNLMTNESALGLLKVLEQSNANLMELKLDANKGVGDSTLEAIQNILQGRSRSKRMFRLSQKGS